MSEIIWLQTTFDGAPFRMSGYVDANGQPQYSALQRYVRRESKAHWRDTTNAKAMAWIKPLLAERLKQSVHAQK